MSIGTMVENDKSLKGLTMRYEDGGKVQVYRLGDKEIKFGPTATDGEIVAAFKEQK